MVKQVQGMRCLDQLMRNERTGAGTMWVTVTGSRSHAGAAGPSDTVTAQIMELIVHTLYKFMTTFNRSEQNEHVYLQTRFYRTDEQYLPAHTTK